MVKINPNEAEQLKEEEEIFSEGGQLPIPLQFYPNGIPAPISTRDDSQKGLMNNLRGANSASQLGYQKFHDDFRFNKEGAGSRGQKRGEGEVLSRPIAEGSKRQRPEGSESRSFDLRGLVAAPAVDATRSTDGGVWSTSVMHSKITKAADELGVVSADKFESFIQCFQKKCASPKEEVGVERVDLRMEVDVEEEDEEIQVTQTHKCLKLTEKKDELIACVKERADESKVEAKKCFTDLDLVWTLHEDFFSGDALVIYFSVLRQTFKRAFKEHICLRVGSPINRDQLEINWDYGLAPTEKVFGSYIFREDKQCQIGYDLNYLDALARLFELKPTNIAATAFLDLSGADGKKQSTIIVSMNIMSGNIENQKPSHVYNTLYNCFLEHDLDSCKENIFANLMSREGAVKVGVRAAKLCFYDYTHASERSGRWVINAEKHKSFHLPEQVDDIQKSYSAMAMQLKDRENCDLEKLHHLYVATMQDYFDSLKLPWHKLNEDGIEVVLDSDKYKAGVHAEMKIVDKLVELSKTGFSFGLDVEAGGRTVVPIGISKPSCSHCASALNAINLDVSLGFKVAYTGKHGNSYKKWSIPQFLLTSEEGISGGVFRHFIGEEANVCMNTMVSIFEDSDSTTAQIKAIIEQQSETVEKMPGCKSLSFNSVIKYPECTLPSLEAEVESMGSNQVTAVGV